MKNDKRNIAEPPGIAGFVCNWVGYSGVEMAGINKIPYPAGVKLVRLTCMGRISLGLLLRAFELGADGVIMLGCPADMCNYNDGMHKAREVYQQANAMLALLGIGEKRLSLVEVPAGDGEFVARELNAFSKLVASEKARISRKADKQRRTVKETV